MNRNTLPRASMLPRAIKLPRASMLPRALKAPQAKMLPRVIKASQAEPYRQASRLLPILLFALLLFAGLVACNGGAGGDRIYDQGTWVSISVDREKIETLTSDTPSGYPALLGQWGQSPLNAAFYFTADLLKLPEGEPFELVTKGAGLMVLGADHKIVGYYEGPQTLDANAAKIAVALVLQADRSVWQIQLARLWEKGPWLVTGLQSNP
ncbi:MAG: hypothetical protein NTV33_02030 [Coprothermobacterota bacterium]|nr:hypothetical protein [Coprothermobacterota bacterium]